MLLVAMVVVWAVLFRQQGIGGHAAYVEVNTSAMAPTIPKGNLVVVERQSSYQSGDVVAYVVPGAGQPAAPITVVGRIVGGDGTTGFVIKSDNLPAADSVHPTNADVVGKVWFHLRKAFRWPITAAVAALFIVLVIAAWPSRRRRVPTDVVAGPTPAGAGERVRRVSGAGAPGPRKVDPSATAGGAVTPTSATAIDRASAPDPLPVIARVDSPVSGDAPTPDSVALAPLASLSEPTGGSYWESTKRRSGGPAHAKKRSRRRKDK